MGCCFPILGQKECVVPGERCPVLKDFQPAVSSCQFPQGPWWPGTGGGRSHKMPGLAALGGSLDFCGDKPWPWFTLWAKKYLSKLESEVD